MAKIVLDETDVIRLLAKIYSLKVDQVVVTGRVFFHVNLPEGQITANGIIPTLTTSTKEHDSPFDPRDHDPGMS